MTLFAISVNIKHFFVRLNSAVFKVFICINRKLPFLCLPHPLFKHLHTNPKWTAMRHSQMVNVAKYALSSKVFSPQFTQAWKLLPGYFLFLLSICLFSAKLLVESRPYYNIDRGCFRIGSKNCIRIAQKRCRYAGKALFRYRSRR